MAEKPEKTSEKTIEMRLAEVEDKLSQLHITEEEMKTYQKVAAALGMSGQATGAPGAAPARGSHQSSTAALLPSGLLSSAGSVPVSARADHVTNAHAVLAVALRAVAAHSAADSADSEA